MKFSGRIGTPFKQRGVLGLSFSRSRSKSQSIEDSNVQKNATQRTQQTQQEDKQTTSEQKTTTKLLSQDIQDVLEQLILAQAGPEGAAGSAGASGGDINDIANQLLERAETAESALNQQNAAILADASRRGNQKIDAGITELAAQTGSTQNSFVQQTGLEAKAQLDSSLAALSAQLQTGARSTATDEFKQAAELLVQSSGATAQNQQGLSQLIAQLRGATATQVQASEQNVSGTTELTSEQTLEELIKALTVNVSKSKGTKFGATASTK